MGIKDKLSGLFKRNREPVTEEYREYKECLELNLSDINRYEKYVNQYSDKLSELEAQGVNQNGNYFVSVLDELNHFKYSLYETEKTTEFIRENSPEDIEYRNSLVKNFAEYMKELIPETSPLRFHGTPIYFAKEILKSGGISSSADRFDGFIKSTDRVGEISVSDINSLSRTVNYYMDAMAYQRCLPCGCLFILDAEGQTQQQKSASVMNSVDFNKEPDRLFAILSTPENIPHIKEWLIECGLSPDLAYSFDEFICEIERGLQKHSEQQMKSTSSLNGHKEIASLDEQITNAQEKVGASVENNLKNMDLVL